MKAIGLNFTENNELDKLKKKIYLYQFFYALINKFLLKIKNSTKAIVCYMVYLNDMLLNY